MKQVRMSGLTLIELLIALALSIVTVVAMISVFMANRESFDLSDSLSRIQENVRYTTTLLTADLTSVGYMGCAPATTENLTDISTVPDVTPNQIGDFSQTLIGGEATGPNNSDNLTIHYALIETAIPLGNATDNAYSAADGNTTTFSSNADVTEYQAGDIIAISDCQNMMVSQLASDPSGSSFAHSGIATTDTFGGSTDTPATIYKMYGVDYHLVTIDQGDGTAVSALTATYLDGAEQTLVTGIEDFQVEYGIDTNNDRTAERYINWSQVNAGNFQSDISSIRVSLTINPGDPVSDPLGQDSEFNKTSVFTVAIRNQGD